MPLTREQAEKYIIEAQNDGYSDDEITTQLKEIGVSDAPVVAAPVAPTPGFAAPGTVPGGSFARAAFAKLFNANLPALLDPAVYVSLGADAGRSLMKTSTDIMLNPRAVMDYVTGSRDRVENAPTALHPRTKAVLNFVHPESLWDMMVAAPAAMANDALVAVSPVAIGPSGIPTMTSPEVRQQAAAKLWADTKAMLPIDAFKAIRETYGEKGMDGVNEMLTEHPEVAPGVLLPLLMVAGGVATKRGAPVRIDAVLQDAMAQSLDAARTTGRLERKGTKAASPGRAANDARTTAFNARTTAFNTAFNRLRAMTDETVPDPAIEMVVRMLTEEKGGRLEARSLDLGLKSLDLVPTVEELGQAENIARLRAHAIEAMRARPHRDPKVIASPVGDVEVGSAVLSHLRDTTGAAVPKGQRVLGPGLPQQAVERPAIVGDNINPGAGRFRPARPSTAKPFDPSRLAPPARPSAIVEGPVLTDTVPEVYLADRYNRGGGFVSLPGTFIRFGDIPKSGRSQRYLRDHSEGPVIGTAPEEGVSTYKAWYDPRTKKYVLMGGGEDLLTGQGELGAGKRPVYEIRGRELRGVGGDEEALLQDAKLVRAISRDDIVSEQDPGTTLSGIDLSPEDTPTWGTPETSRTPIVTDTAIMPDEIVHSRDDLLSLAGDAMEQARARYEKDREAVDFWSDETARDPKRQAQLDNAKRAAKSSFDAWKAHEKDFSTRYANMMREGEPRETPPIERIIDVTPIDARTSLARRLATATQGIAVPGDQAAALAQAIATQPIETVDRLVRAMETAAKIDPSLVRAQVQRLANGAQAKPGRGPIETEIADAAPEPPATRLSPRDAADIAETVGSDLDSVQRAIDRLGMGQHPIAPVAEPAASRSPAAAARAAGTSFSTLRAKAAERGLEVTIAGDSYSLRSASGSEVTSIPVRQADAHTTLARAIDEHNPTPAPDTPPASEWIDAPIRRNRSESGHINIDLATLGISNLVERYRTTPRDINRAYDIVDRFLLGLLSPTELARQLGPRGHEIVGLALRGVEVAQARGQEAIIKMPERLRQFGVGDDSPRDRAIGLVADTLEIPDTVTKGAALIPDPTLTALGPAADAQIAAARAAWDRMSKPDREVLVEWQKFARDTYEQAHRSAMERETYDALGARGALVSATSPDARTRFGGQPLGAPRAEEVAAAASPLEARILARGAGADRALAPDLIPSRFSAYASHVAYDALTGGPWDEAMATLKRAGFDPQDMANELTDAFQASVHSPRLIRGNRYTDRVAALRALLPGVADADLGQFIKYAEGDISKANRDVNRVMSVFKKNLFTRYFQERVSRLHPEQGIPARRMMEAYIGSVMQKIHIEPALHRARGLLTADRALDPALAARFHSALDTIVGNRIPDGPSMRLAGRRLASAINFGYMGTLLGNPEYFITNGGQFAVFGAPELMTGKHAASLPEMHSVLARPEFNELLTNMGVIQEAMPYDMLVRLNKNGMNVRDIFDTFGKVNEEVAAGRLSGADALRAGRAAVKDITKKGLHVSDILAFTETYQRRWTAAASAVKHAKEMGIWDAVKSGNFGAIPPGAWEMLQNRMVTDIGNTNFFMGRGSNQVGYLSYFTKRLPAISRPFLTYTAYKAGATARMASLLLDLKKGDAPTKIRAATALGGMATVITGIAGPAALVPFTEWVDKETSADGAFTAFMKEWQRRYNLVGLLSWAGSHAARAGGRAATALGSDSAFANALGNESGPTPGLDLTSKMGVSSFPMMLNPAESQTFQVASDVANLGPAVTRHMFHKPPTPEQEDAARRLLGRLAPRLAGVDVNSDIGPIPPDLAIYLPLGRMTNTFTNALGRHNAEARIPGARTDERGRLLDVRTATETAIGAFGPLARDTETKRRRMAGAESSKMLTAEKGRFVRALVKGDGEAAVKALKGLESVAPGYIIDPTELGRLVKDEALARFIDRETMTFQSLAEPLAIQRIANAAQRLTDPKWLSAATEPERRRETLILGLGMQRFRRQSDPAGR